MPDPGRGVVLVGMPGSGKSTVGRQVARILGRPFLDTDQLVEEAVGMPVGAFIARHGEAAFRDAEARAVVAASAVPDAVIGAGGGAALDPLSRWALWHHGPVAWVDVASEALVARLGRSAVERPTFLPYRAGHVATVLAERRPVYHAANLRVDGERPPDVVAREIVDHIAAVGTGRRLLDAEVARRHPIGPTSTRVVLGSGLLEHGAVGEPTPAGVLVVDRAVARHAPHLAQGLPARATLALRGGERAKRISMLERVLAWLAAQHVERGEALIALGGGTIGDLAGTAAALFARGLPLVHVPTTWLAQADSSIGGKVAVDLPTAKNAVGAFWPPATVVTDVAALASLPVTLRRDGMAESVKAAIIGDPRLWSLIEDRGRAALHDDEAARFAIIERSVRLKLAVCDRDPWEAGERRTLNLGHTIGHALEVAGGYRLPHGAAVAVGLRAVARIAARRGGDGTLPDRLDTLLADLGFALTTAFDPVRVRDAMGGDKKRAAGRQRWILPLAVGSVTEVDDVTDDELDDALSVIHA